MKVIHPKTKSVLLMAEDCPLIAEIEQHPAIEDPEYQSVLFGEIGYSGATTVYRADWTAFKALVAEIDEEWSRP